MNTVPIALTFEFAIRFPTPPGMPAKYYLGPKWVGAKPSLQQRVDDPKNVGPKREAYTYTENRAYHIIDHNPIVFAGCTVEKVL